VLGRSPSRLETKDLVVFQNTIRAIGLSRVSTRTLPAFPVSPPRATFAVGVSVATAGGRIPMQLATPSRPSTRKMLANMTYHKGEIS
jgi:hypothetical protein